MTATQTTRIDDAAKLVTAIMDGLRGCDVMVEFKGRKVTGGIVLAIPNPRGRLHCKIAYTVPASWSQGEHEGALRVAAHWFRDIGGLQTICKKHLCHIVGHFKVDMAERDMHFAIKAYAASDWHRQNKAWMQIARFFVRDHVELWIDKSDDLRRERDDDWQRKHAASHEAHEEQRLAADRKKLREERSRKRPSNPIRPPSKPASKPKLQTIWDAIQALPKSHRWVIPVLVSHRSKTTVRSKAKAKLEETVSLLWPILPDSARSQVRAHVQAEVFRRTGALPEPATRPTKHHLRAILKVAQQHRSRIKPIGDDYTMSKALAGMMPK